MKNFVSSIVFIIYVLCICSKHYTCVHIPMDLGRPAWAHEDKCVAHLAQNASWPSYTLCDPDDLIRHKKIERGIQLDSMHACRVSLASSVDNAIDNVSIIVIVVKDVHFDTSSKGASPLAHLRDCVVDWFELSSLRAYLVLLKMSDFEVLEWFSEPLRAAAATTPRREGRALERLYVQGLGVHGTLWAAETTVCDVMKDLFRTPKGIQIIFILWVFLAVVFPMGLVAFVCWLYRFSRNHPTNSCAESQAYQESGLRSSASRSDYLLTSSEIEAAMPYPAESGTREDVRL